MPKHPSSSSGSPGPKPSSALAERVQARVSEAGATISRSSAWKSGGDPQSLGMRRVFRSMGRSYRLYRRQTGDHVSAAVRNAAIAFREDPTLAGLTEVAARLEQEGVVNW